ncbi:MAG: heparan-alpha-glucosaminide N-acetyltransferase domain-containing protein [Comamonas sp.]
MASAVLTPLPSASSPPRTAAARLQSIDALRGLVIVFMLLDHVRETFYLHAQVADPMDVAATPAALFFSRLLAHVCAPVFVLLTGLSAFLYASRQDGGRAAASAFLFKRGLVLVLLELTLVNFAWTFQFPPAKIYLQVIWAIGLSMLALSALVWLPRAVLVAVGVLLVAGHNLLDGLHFAPGHALHLPWAILHDRGWIVVSDALRLRTSYPVLPWIGVIALGYAAGPWFKGEVAPARRQRALLATGLGLIAGFAALRALNVYGDTPWQAGATALASTMSFLNITKYPPSLLFLLLTLGIGLLCLFALERLQQRHGGRLPPAAAWLMAFGAAPMFFYLLHLYVLKFLYLAAVSIWGLNHGDYFGFDSVGAVWLGMLVLAAALYAPVKAFAAFKARRRDIAWLKYL